MRKALTIAALSLAVLLLAGFGAAVFLAGSPRDAYGMLRYAVWQMRSGEVQVGDRAPDIELLALDGTTRFRLRDRLGRRPLVLVFGSYT